MVARARSLVVAAAVRCISASRWIVVRVYAASADVMRM
ncbi:Hypothetical protein A7982_08239 [Minicystis rosea]|nr:Hypothetical protein A7982_08239 [Minicystis rosea]